MNKETQDLNNKYCLATPEQYIALSQDSKVTFSSLKEGVEGGFYTISGNMFHTFYGNKETLHKEGFTLMHYHNGKWVFGSLEHKEDTLTSSIKKIMEGKDELLTKEEQTAFEDLQNDTMELIDSTDKLLESFKSKEPKPVKRITNIKFLKMTDKEKFEYIKMLEDKIENLEAKGLLWHE